MAELVKYRLIRTEDETTVLLEDGGIAIIHSADEIDPGDGRQSVTEYYQDRFTEEMLVDLDDEGFWEKLGEGKMYYNDWTTDETDPEHVIDALNWLCIESTFVEDNSIWPTFNK